MLVKISMSSPGMGSVVIGADTLGSTSSTCSTAKTRPQCHQLPERLHL
jgi:hypothetical protein